MNVDVVDYIYFPRLLYGRNQIEISGNAQVTFTYRYPVKVGAY
jgi:phage-related protein